MYETWKFQKLYFKCFLFEYLKGKQYVLYLIVQLQLNRLLVCKQEETYLNVYNRHLHL